MELALRRRIAVYKEPAGRHHRKPCADRILEVIDERPTGETLLDEALKAIKMQQSENRRFTIAEWIDLLSGKIII